MTTGGNCLSNTFKRVYRAFKKKVSIVWHMIFFKCPVFSKFTPITCLHPSSVYTKLFCKILALKLRKIFVLTDYFVTLTKKNISVDQFFIHWHFSTYFFCLNFFCLNFFPSKLKISSTFFPLLGHHLELCSVTNWLLRCKHLNSQLLTKYIFGWCSLKYQISYF